MRSTHLSHSSKSQQLPINCFLKMVINYSTLQPGYCRWNNNKQTLPFPWKQTTTTATVCQSTASLLHDKDTHIYYSSYNFLIYSKARGWQKKLKCVMPPIYYMNEYLNPSQTRFTSPSVQKPHRNYFLYTNVYFSNKQPL